MTASCFSTWTSKHWKLKAHSLDPDQPDGCRELGLIYLQVGRAGDALPIALHAFELRPTDPGWRCNLARR